MVTRPLKTIERLEDVVVGSKGLFRQSSSVRVSGEVDTEGVTVPAIEKAGDMKIHVRGTMLEKSPILPPT